MEHLMEHRYRVVNVDRDTTIRRPTLEVAEAAAHAMRLAGDRAIVLDAEALAPAELPQPASIAVAPSPEEIARVCHEANRALRAALGDDSQPSWATAPDWQVDSVIAGVLAVLGNLAMTPEQLHAEWAARKRAEGWTWGEVKDAEAKTHPCLVENYADLPPEQRAKDYLFGAIVRAMTAGKESSWPAKAAANGAVTDEQLHHAPGT